MLLRNVITTGNPKWHALNHSLSNNEIVIFRKFLNCLLSTINDNEFLKRIIQFQIYKDLYLINIKVNRIGFIF